MQNVKFYAMLYCFTALKRGLHHFTALKWCSANAAARRSVSEVTRRGGEATARAIQRVGRAYTRRQAGAGSWSLTRVGELAAAKYLCA